MKKIQFIDSIRNIKRRKIAFLSILGIIIIAISGLLCIYFFEASLKMNASSFLNGCNLKDLEADFSMGITDEYIKKIALADGVKEVEGFYRMEATLLKNDSNQKIQIYSLSEKINTPHLVDGALPKAEDECTLPPELMSDLGLHIGDKVHLRSAQKLLDEILVHDEFTITGTAYHPESFSKGDTPIIILPLCAFDKSKLMDGFIGTYIDLDIPDNVDMFSKNYFSRVNDYKMLLEKTADEIANDRTEEVIEKKKAEAMNFGSMLLYGMKMMGEDQQLTEEPTQCLYLLMNREMNASYEELCNVIQSILTFASFFSPLFALLGIIVCFSTIAVIIEEQKKEVGTIKALGFHNRKIRSKYLMFGILASLLGIIIGIGLAVVLERCVQMLYEDRYVFGKFPIVVIPSISIMFSLATITAVCITVRAACRSLLKCSAMGLINGSEPKIRSTKKSKKDQTGNRKKSLYASLILNNIRNDHVRILVGIFIIAGSTLLICSGISLSLSLNKTFDRQDHDINLYDFRLFVNECAPDDTKTEIESILQKMGAAYEPVYYGSCQVTKENEGFGTNLTCIDFSNIQEYINLENPANNSKFTPATDRILISRTLADDYHLMDGTKIKLFNNSLRSGESIAGSSFNFYIGSDIIVSPESYEKIFGSEFEPNYYFVKNNGADSKELIARLTDTQNDIGKYTSISYVTDDIGSMRLLQTLFLFMSVIMIFLATVMNLLIMINSTNILVARRMKELLVMRINGFSMRQVIGYLVRETTFTTCCGISVGVLCGFPFVSAIITSLGTSAFSLINKPFIPAWICSILLNIIFAVVVNMVSFRNIAKVPLTEITKY